MTMGHDFTSRIVWTGNRGEGTRTYRSYDRTWDIAVPGKAPVPCSNDPALGGDPAKMNPEDLLLSSLAACHMLWYLHYASEAGIVVLGYRDQPVGQAETLASGAGRFVSAELRPEITVAAGTDLAAAEAIHARIHAVCFIARSVSFPVRHVARYVEAGRDGQG
ncbi:MAG: OsmC family protein [Defluviimonas sp.]|nr:OsmC family protein [Defluviimonas sp.]